MLNFFCTAYLRKYRDYHQLTFFEILKNFMQIMKIFWIFTNKENFFAITTPIKFFPNKENFQRMLFACSCTLRVSAYADQNILEKIVINFSSIINDKLMWSILLYIVEFFILMNKLLIIYILLAWPIHCTK